MLPLIQLHALTMETASHKRRLVAVAEVRDLLEGA